MTPSRRLLPFLLLQLPAAGLAAADTPALVGQTFRVRDTLDVGEDPSEDARRCLAGLAWTPEEFDVACLEAARDRGDVLVRFPSPVPSADRVNDLVAMEWYFARDESLAPVSAPAIVVVHESGSAMPVGRMFARGLRQMGLHAFLIHLPHYGERRSGRRPSDAAQLVVAIRQAVADVRRARDAAAALPLVDRRHIALQGTSLGGFVAAAAGSLDRGFDSVFLMLAGGELFELIQNGQRDAAKVRQQLQSAGITDEQLQALLATIEPTRIAHRLDPHRTWLYSATRDQVVPLKNALALAEAAGLDRKHHVLLPADHYTGVVYLPVVLSHMRDQVLGHESAGAEKAPAIDGAQ